MTRSVLVVLMTLIAAGAWLAGATMGPYAMSKEPRFPQLTMEQLSEGQKPLAEQIMKVSSVGLGGPYNPLLRSPVLGQRIFDLFHYLRWETSVPLRLNEFAILIIGRQWRSQVEWFACAARHQGRPRARHRRGPQGQQAAREHAAGRGRGVRLRHRAHDQTRSLR